MLDRSAVSATSSARRAGSTGTPTSAAGRAIAALSSVFVIGRTFTTEGMKTSANGGAIQRPVIEIGPQGEDDDELPIGLRDSRGEGAEEPPPDPLIGDREDLFELVDGQDQPPVLRHRPEGWRYRSRRSTLVEELGEPDRQARDLRHDGLDLLQWMRPGENGAISQRSDPGIAPARRLGNSPAARALDFPDPEGPTRAIRRDPCRSRSSSSVTSPSRPK